LIQGLSITQISFLLGFTATSSFQVAFKRWYEQSPGDYRRDQMA
ncbi:MAG TPA: AraC family transcriptional regulator, partial [Halieaceae bacterium]|nr:AraC family transcriptional regulator [Halieaceae bacterium]